VDLGRYRDAVVGVGVTAMAFVETMQGYFAESG
jgi:hypothetical protein